MNGRRPSPEHLDTETEASDPVALHHDKKIEPCPSSLDLEDDDLDDESSLRKYQAGSLSGLQEFLEELEGAPEGLCRKAFRFVC